MSQINGARDLLFTRGWHQVSARDRTLGRLAEAVARVLMGKHKPMYDPSSDRYGDFVVVTNCEDILVTGKKEHDKIYYHSTTRPGSLRAQSLHELRQDQPERIIREAVSGMLPKNSHRRSRLFRLKLYRGEDHPYEANLLKQHTDPVPKTQPPAHLVTALKKPDPKLIGEQGPTLGPVAKAILEQRSAKIDAPKPE